MASQSEDSATAIEEVVSELHRRGVERGEREYERLIAEARKEAADIVTEAESHKQHLIDDGRREAARLVESANGEAEQLLRAFLGSLPDVFSRRASQFIRALGDRSFSKQRGPATLRHFVDCIDGDKIEQLQTFLDSADPQTFLEALLILSIVFYSNKDGFDHFEIDADLQSRLAQIVSDGSLEPGIGFEFRNGISGFRVLGGNGRELEVSEESLKHMAGIWAGDEFREVLIRVLAEEPLPGASRDV
jgi:F0F1-type ATP synthase membrane subunit b/b'